MADTKRFYITTAISYINGPPHMGHGYEALATDVIALAVKVIRMTTGTIRLERRISPVDDFRIGLMACGTLQIAAVVQRFVR